jgi:8-oxo-dGTP pyrophosphatase MutT (NUDIX family)
VSDFPDMDSVEWGDPEPPRVVSSRTVYEGRMINMRVDDIALSEGRTATREVVAHRGAVVIAAVDGEGCVYLVRQYRHAIGQYLLELPAGCLEADEEPLAAAQRELREEVGLEARLWTPLGDFFSSPGFANERLHAFLARALTPVESDPDDDEDICVVRYPLTDLFTYLELIEDAKTLATLCLLGYAVLDDPLDATRGV